MRVSKLALLFVLFAGTGLHGQGPQPRLGPPPAAPVTLGEEHLYQPSPYHVWIDGFWAPLGNEYAWFSGYWTLPPYYGARWRPPYYDPRDDRYYYGYWDGDRLRQYRTYETEEYEGSQYSISDDRFDSLRYR